MRGTKRLRGKRMKIPKEESRWSKVPDRLRVQRAGPDVLGLNPAVAADARLQGLRRRSVLRLNQD